MRLLYGCKRMKIVRICRIDNDRPTLSGYGCPDMISNFTVPLSSEFREDSDIMELTSYEKYKDDSILCILRVGSSL